MSKKVSQPVTAEQAIAKVLRIDYIPNGITLLELTAGLLEEAEIDLDNAKVDVHVAERKGLAVRANICETRHRLAQELFDGFELELDSEACVIARVPSAAKTDKPLFDMSTVADWAYYKYGIGTPTGFDFGSEPPPLSWDEVTIKIYAGFQLGVQVGSGPFRRTSFHAIGLMGSRKNKANELGLILIGLSQKKKYPPSKPPLAKHKTAISKLRNSLSKLVAIRSDPFAPFNPADGWRPRFKLIADTRNAAERAKKSAHHVSYEDALGHDEDTPDFEFEDDEAQRFISSKEDSY